MRRYENDCCECATDNYRCLGYHCPRRRVEHFYCDACGDESKLYFYDGKELCISCVESLLEHIEGSENV
jgi:hypothetical protein